MSISDATTAVSEELAARADMIVCDGVDKWFGDFQALKGVSARIKEQEVVVVLGPSGSGKSTWIRCINRLEIHQGGTIIGLDAKEGERWKKAVAPIIEEYKAKMNKVM